MNDAETIKPTLTEEAFMRYVKSLEKASVARPASNPESDVLILNGSLLHALAVYTQMIKNLICVPDSKANFYCGNAVLFRKNACKDVIDACRKKYSQYPSEVYIKQVYDVFVTALRNFMSDRTHKLSLVVEEQSLGEYETNPIIPVLSENKEQFSFSMLPFDLGLPHFAVAGRAYRFEVSDSDKTAFCCFNGNEERLNTMNTTYNHLLSLSIR